jgi:hypothetical protein
VGLVVILGSLAAGIFELSINAVAVAAVIAVMAYNFLILRRGNTITRQFDSTISFLLYLYNYRYFLPLAVYIVLYILLDSFYISVLSSMAFYTILNYRDLLYAFGKAKQLLLSSEYLDITNGNNVAGATG